MRKNAIAAMCALMGLLGLHVSAAGSASAESKPFGESWTRFAGKWFSVEIPDSWKSSTSRSGGTLFLAAPGGLIQTSGNNNVVLGMSAEQMPLQGGDSANVLSGAMDSLLADNPGTAVVSRKATTWQGKPAERLTLAGTNSATGDSEVSEILAVASDGNLSLFVLTVPKNQCERWRKSVDRIIHSILIRGLPSRDP